MYLLNPFRRMFVRPSRRRNHTGSNPPIEGLESRSLLSGHSLVGALGSLEGTVVEQQDGSETSTQQTSPVRDEDIRNGGFSSSTVNAIREMDFRNGGLASSTVNAIREMDLRNGGFGSSTVNPVQADDFIDVYSDEFFDVWVELGKPGAGIDDDFGFPAPGNSLADGAVDSGALTRETSPLREEDLRNGGFGSSTVYILAGQQTIDLADGAVSNRGTAVGNPGDPGLAGGNQNRLDEVTFTIAGHGIPGSVNPDHVGIPVYLDQAQQPGLAPDIDSQNSIDADFQLPFDHTAIDGVNGPGDALGMDAGIDMTALASLFDSMGGDGWSPRPGGEGDDEGDPPYGGNDDSSGDDDEDTKRENEERRRRKDEGPDNEDDDHPNPGEDEFRIGLDDQIDAQFMSWLEEQMTAAHTQQVLPPAIDDLRPW
jgi:hypothetical protein